LRSSGTVQPASARRIAATLRKPWLVQSGSVALLAHPGTARFPVLERLAFAAPRLLHQERLGADHCHGGYSLGEFGVDRQRQFHAGGAFGFLRLEIGKPAAP
jgi:hypothetical protein